MHKKRIIIVLTNEDSYSSTGEKTGLWLGELVHVYDLLKRTGYTTDFVSPKGGRVPLDPRGLQWPFLDRLTRSYFRNAEFMGRLERTLAPSDIDPEHYIAIYYTGGHGTMWDFPQSKELSNIARDIYEKGGIVAAMCHGSCGLLNIKLGDTHIIRDKRVTGFSWTEEILAGKTKHVPFNLEEELKKRGAIYSKAWLPLLPYAISDGRLVTGQNPQSAKAVAKKILSALTSLSKTQ